MIPVIKRNDKYQMQILSKCRRQQIGYQGKTRPRFEKGIKWFVAYQNYYEGTSDLDPYFYHGFWESRFGEVYAWFNVKDGLQIFGTAARKGAKIHPYLSEYTEMLKNRFGLKLKKLVRKTGCLGNDMCTTGRFYLGKGKVPPGWRSSGISQCLWRRDFVCIINGFIRRRGNNKRYQIRK